MGRSLSFLPRNRLLDINFAETVFALVDRLAVSAGERSRIVDAVEIAYRESGEVIFEAAPRDGEALAAAAFLPALRVQKRWHSL